ncbi:MAG TPA: helix-turn-helix domain-containing protein [Pyrinomonadaceae bacterium]|nr:helix-turn-helix domain-containing protein [Pyrinomonadaceae bacterium]
MIRPSAHFVQFNRFFVSNDFSVSYRRAKQLQWQNQASSGYSLLAVLNGKLSYTTDSKPIDLPADQFVLFGPNLSITANATRAELLFVTFSASVVMQHAATMRLIPPNSTVAFKTDHFSGDRKLDGLFAEFASELSDEKPGKDIVLRALAEQLLVHALRNYAQPRRSEELELSRAGLIDRRIRRSVELMYTQLDQDLTLKALAAASYLSPFHFARLFKKLTGSTPHNYLAGIRAARAQLLLAETELSVTEIGSRVGYLSASHFTKAFRVATGTTPREFRKALISTNNNTSANERQ